MKLRGRYGQKCAKMPKKTHSVSDKLELLSLAPMHCFVKIHSLLLPMSTQIYRSMTLLFPPIGKLYQFIMIGLHWACIFPFRTSRLQSPRRQTTRPWCLRLPSPELRDRVTAYERNHNICRFIYSTPFTVDGVSGAWKKQQYPYFSALSLAHINWAWRKHAFQNSCIFDCIDEHRKLPYELYSPPFYTTMNMV